MAYRTPTVSEFKSQFPRDFPWGVPAWGAAGSLTLVAGVFAAVALTAGGFGYKTAPSVSVVAKYGAGATFTTTVAGGKVTALTLVSPGAGYSDDAYLVFTGGAGDDTNLELVRDDDIVQAQQTADFNINPDLFGGTNDYARAFNLLTAHYLVENLLAAGEGLASQYNWLTTSKGVGDVKESYQIPKRISDDPMLSMWSKTRYGAIYISIISPLIVGNMQTHFRRTPP